jgi:Flp pilus assembly protein TadB
MDERYVKNGWGVILGVGGAFAITAWYADNPVLAAVIAVITIVATIVAYVRTRETRALDR